MNGEGAWTPARRGWTAAGLASPILLLTFSNWIYRQHESGALRWEPALTGAVALFLLTGSLAGFALACREFYRRTEWPAPARILVLVALCAGFVLFGFMAAYVFSRTAFRTWPADH